MQSNAIICGDAVTELARLPVESVDLTVFSPPYDELRDYDGYACDLHALGAELYRVTRDGGVVVMVIQDQTRGGKKTLTSFRTILDWCDAIGFGLFECNIYRKQGKDGAWWSKRFRVDHEYMPVFVKGEKPRCFDKTRARAMSCWTRWSAPAPPPSPRTCLIGATSASTSVASIARWRSSASPVCSRTWRRGLRTRRVCAPGVRWLQRRVHPRVNSPVCWRNKSPVIGVKS